MNEGKHSDQRDTETTASQPLTQAQEMELARADQVVDKVMQELGPAYPFASVSEKRRFCWQKESRFLTELKHQHLWVIRQALERRGGDDAEKAMKFLEEACDG